MNVKVILSSVLFAFALIIGCASDDKTSTGPGNNNNNPGTIATDSIVDAEGNYYKIVQIGTQWWMAENLQVTKYANGDPIANLTIDSMWQWTTSGAYCDVENNSANRTTYGYLYNGFAIADPRGIAPAGWHIPSDSEWTVLSDYLGTNAGGKTKTTGLSLWKTPNLGATNETGFSAVPAGVRPPAGVFTNKTEIAFYWSTTQALPYPLISNYLCGMGYAEQDFRRQYAPFQMGLSVRCVKD